MDSRQYDPKEEARGKDSTQGPGSRPVCEVAGAAIQGTQGFPSSSTTCGGKKGCRSDFAFVLLLDNQVR